MSGKKKIELIKSFIFKKLKRKELVLFFSILAVIVVVGFGIGINMFSPKISESQTIKDVAANHSQIIAGQTVKWTKVVAVDAIQKDKQYLKLPKDAQNITVKTGQDAIDFLKEKPTKELTLAEKKQLATSLVQPKANKPNILVRVGRFLTAILGNAINQIKNIFIKDKEESKFVDLMPFVQPEQIIHQPIEEVTSATESSGHVVVEYETPAPRITEQKVGKGKLVIVSATDEDPATPLVDVLAYANVPEFYSVAQKNRIKIYWREDKSYVKFNAYDLDKNGKIDYVEWNVPHLSSQTFEVILISNAELLDNNRQYIQDIYDKVGKKDRNYASIPSGNYVRVTFEKNLIAGKDMTVYAKGLGSIEVYNKDANEIIGEFAIDGDKEYKIYPNYTDADVYDLLFSGNIEVDYIVDPYPDPDFYNYCPEDDSNVNQGEFVCYNIPPTPEYDGWTSSGNVDVSGLCDPYGYGCDAYIDIARGTNYTETGYDHPTLDGTLVASCDAGIGNLGLGQYEQFHYGCSVSSGLYGWDYPETPDGAYSVIAWNREHGTVSHDVWLGVYVFNLDTTPPTTTATATIGNGSTNYAFGNWAGDQVAAYLFCDDASGSGCSIGYYCVDNEDTCIPTISYDPNDPITIYVSDEGTTYLRYFSIDALGNTEEASIKSSQINIDKSGPYVDAGRNKVRGVLFTQNAYAGGSYAGIASYEWSKVSGPGNIIFGTATTEDPTIRADADGRYVIRLTVIDDAGNSASDDFNLVWNTKPPVSTHVNVDVTSAQDQGNPFFCLPAGTTMSIIQDSTVLDTKTMANEICVDDLIVSNPVNLISGFLYSVKLSASTCNGYVDDSGNCWYGGNVGQSCNDVCLNKGGTKTANCSESDLDCSAIENVLNISCGMCDPYSFPGLWLDQGIVYCTSGEYPSQGCDYSWMGRNGHFGLKRACVCNNGTGAIFNFPFTAGS